MNRPKDLDPECTALYDAMNAFPGIHTVGSCCGHGEHPFRMFFDADNIESLAPMLYFVDS